jgi:cyclohexa-1,5-dienecarbonyl-CoA hydratase
MFRVEKKTNHATIYLERPPLNILNIDMMEGLRKTLRIIGKEKDLKILVLEGSEKAFSAGVDVTEHQGEKVRVMIRNFHNLIKKLESFPLPTLAVVQGMALGGGCEFACACDIILAEEKAKFGQPEISLGVFPPYAALRLPEIIGPRLANKILYSGKMISATEAERIGLISGALSSAMLRSEVYNLIKSLTEKSGAALRILKQAIRSRNLKAIENLYLNDLMKTHDAEEGLSAFMEKRKPVWKNK